jgi:pimeloyl-ACP methyl ester carboxylesterase
MAEDVAGFIDEHELRDTSLIGHSMSAIPDTLQELN